MYKFREVNGSSIHEMNLGHHDELTDGSHELFRKKTHFQASFASYLAIAANIPSTLSFLINGFISRW